MRYIVYGAGAIGATIGARLVDVGGDVAFIARGQHGEEMQRNGLTFETPEWTRNYRIPVVADPRELEIVNGDVVVLCMKTQDTWKALQTIFTSAPPETPIFCAQNGVENERMALRHFANVYAVLVSIKSAHLSPGHVQAYDAPCYGSLDTGRYPAGLDAVAEEFVADTSRAGISSIARDDIMSWKYAKLFGFLISSALIVVFGPDTDTKELAKGIADEAYAVAEKAGIALNVAGLNARRDVITRPNMIDTTYNSSWQSALRNLTTIESVYLNGEVVLMGRQVGVPTPLNDLLQRCAQEVIEHKRERGSMTVAEFREHLALKAVA